MSGGGSAPVVGESAPVVVASVPSAGASAPSSAAAVVRSPRRRGRLLALLLAIAAAAAAVAAARHWWPRDEALLFPGGAIEVRDAWPDGTSTGATVAVDAEGRLVVTGAMKDRAYASVYAEMVLDLDKYEAIEIDVPEISHHGYLVFVAPVFEEGYLPLLPYIVRPGRYRYDLRVQTGRQSGRLPVRLEIGVASGKMEVPCDGARLVIREIRLVPARYAPSEREIVLFSPAEGGEAVVRFSPEWDDGTPCGAVPLVVPAPGGSHLVVEGRSEKEPYGSVIANAAVDLDRFGGLRLDVEEVSTRGFAILRHPSLPDGYARLEPEITGRGTYLYDLRRVIGRGGHAKIKVLIGVSTHGRSPKVTGERMRLSRVSFVEPPLRRIEAVRRVAGPDPIAAPAAPAGSPWPDAAAVGGRLLPPLPRLDLAGAPAPSVSAAAGRIAVRGAWTEVLLSAADGRIEEVRDLSTGAAVSVGGPLFQVETVEGGAVSSSEAVARGLARCEAVAEANRAVVRYAFSGFAVEVSVAASPWGGGVGLSAEVRSDSARVLGVTLPGRLALPAGEIEEVVVPRWLGTGLRPGFFREEKSVTFHYPAAGVSDFIHARLGRGALALLGGGLVDEPGVAGNRMRYRGAGIRGENWAGLRPVTITVTGEGGASIARLIPARVPAGRSFSTGEVLVAAGLPLSAAADLYRGRIYPPDVRPLRDRLGTARFDRFAGGALVKIDMAPYADLDRVLEDLEIAPDGVLLHPVSYWPKGFDKNYPDFFPPDARFGGEAGMRRIVEAAHARGMLVVPYVNPTWWNPSTTADRYGVENFSIRNEDGSVPIDVYGENTGWIVSPWFEGAREVRRALHAAAGGAYAFDGLFEDQIGARDWRHDASTHAPAPLAYSAGMVAWASENPLGGFLMTENGFDAVAPFEHGLCGGIYFSWPRGDDPDRGLGRGNWRNVPLASMIYRDLADLFHHDLAVEMRTDSNRKLAWNLAHGIHLFEMLYRDVPPDHARWILVDQVFQREVASRATGRRLVAWREEGDVVRTAFAGGLGVVANLAAAPLALPGAVLPPDGVLAGDTALAAGTFSSLAGFDLGAPRHLVLKRAAGGLEIVAPDGEISFLAVPRDPAWGGDASIRVERAEAGAAPVPCALTEGAVVFLHRPTAYGPPRDVRYRVVVEPAPFEARVRGPARVVAGEKARLEVEVGAGAAGLHLEGAALEAFVVGPAGPAPAPSPDGAVEAVSLPVAPGAGARLAYEVEAPADLLAGERLWATARVKTDRGVRLVSTLIEAVPAVGIDARAPDVVATARPFGVRVRIENRTTRPIGGRLSVSAGGAEIGPPLPVSVAASAAWEGEIRADSLPAGTHDVTVRFRPEAGAAEAAATARVRAVPPVAALDIDGRNLVPPGGVEAAVRIVASEGIPVAGVVTIGGNNGWRAVPDHLTVSAPAGGEIRLPIRILPGEASGGTLTLRFEGPEGGALHAEPYAAAGATPRLLRADLNGDGLEEIAIGHADLEAQVLVGVGGRIIRLSGADGANQLHAPYHAASPRPPDPNAWVEYGGINDWWPKGWPGDVWRNPWEVVAAGAEGAEVRLEMRTRARDGSLSLARTLRITAGSPVLVAEYEIANLTDAEASHTWVAHPDVAPGGRAEAGDRIVSPSAGGTEVHEYAPRIAKVSCRPTAGWVAAADRSRGDVFAVLFAPGSLMEVGTWEGDGFFTLEPIHPKTTIPPRGREAFRIGYGVGRGDPAALAAAWAEAFATAP